MKRFAAESRRQAPAANSIEAGRENVTATYAEEGNSVTRERVEESKDPRRHPCPFVMWVGAVVAAGVYQGKIGIAAERLPRELGTL